MYDKTLYTEAWEIQNACNHQAVLRTWNDTFKPKILEELKITGGGTVAFAAHPVNLIMADKLLQLGGVYSCSETLNRAYATVYNRMTGTEVSNAA